MGFDNADFCCRLRLRCEVDGNLLDHGDRVVQIEVHHLIFDALVDVDRTGVGLRVRAGVVNRAQQLPGFVFHKPHLAAAGTADVGQRCRRFRFRPEPPGWAGPKHSVFGQLGDKLGCLG